MKKNALHQIAEAVRRLALVVAIPWAVIGASLFLALSVAIIFYPQDPNRGDVLEFFLFYAPLMIGPPFLYFPLRWILAAFLDEEPEDPPRTEKAPRR